MVKILAIDDNKHNLLSLKTIINDLVPDSIVFTALNGTAGIELAISNNPDLIFLDILMPEMDGFEVCHLLKQDERVRDIPVVFVTSLERDKENRIKAIETGAEAFLTKPIDKIELLVQIRAMIKIKAANEQKREEKAKLQNSVDGHTNKLELSQIATMNLMKELQAENEAHGKTEKALRKSVELFQGLFNVSPDAFILVDPHHPTISWPIIDCNIAACLMNGYLREELIGRSIDVLHEEAGTIEERISYFEELLLKGTIHKEITHRHKNGHLFPVEVLTSIVILGGKEMVLGIDRDITERKRTEDALRENVNLFHSLFNLSPDAIILIDPHDPVISWPIVDCNIAACKMNGYSRESMVGHSIDLLNETEGSREERTAYLEELRKRGSIQKGIVHHHKDGHIFTIETLSSIITLRGKEMVLGIDRDITERKRIEVALRESQGLYHSFVEHMPAGVFRKDSEGRFIFVNSVFCHLKGMKEDEILGKTPHELSEFEVEANNHSGRKLKQHTLVKEGTNHHELIMQTGLPIEIEEIYLKPDGTTQFLQVVKSPVFSSNGKVIGSQGIQFDITERKRAEIELSSSQSMLRGILDSFPGGVFWKDINSVYQGCNKSFSVGAGLNNTNEIVGKNDYELPWRETEADSYRITDQRVMKNAKAEMGIIETQLQTDGRLVWLETSKIPLFDTQGQVVGILGASHDITNIKQAEKSLLESNELNNSLLQTIPFGMDIVDEHGNVLFLNQNLENLFGQKSIGKKCWNLYRDDNCQCPECPLITGINIGQTSIYETDGILGGKTFQISHAGMFFQGKKAMLEIFQDITEKKQMVDELIAAKVKAEESDRLKSSFLANMSHEIRTPLNSIIGFSDLMLDPFFEPEQHTEFANIIKENGNNLLSIISDIMDISKIEAGQIQIKKQLLSVNQLIIDLQKEFHFKTNEKGIDLRLAPFNPQEEILIKSDSKRLRQILINFIGNAIKFTEKGFIEIGIKPTGEFVQFHIKDTGIGIPKEFHEKVFERFRQVESANTRKHGGNGLGLAISKSLVELLGGKIWMESEQGKGTTFFFTIPK